MIPCITDFQIIRPKHCASQREILDWLVSMHSKAEALKGAAQNDFDTDIKERLFKIGLGPKKIEQRGSHVFDFFGSDKEDIRVVPLKSSLEGRGMKARSLFYESAVDEIFDQFYPIESELPHHLIHVTCTGYVAPSCAQKLVARRGYGTKTTVTHAYHMGCYASIPAIRIASGYLHSLPSPVDIVHTELCTLHMNPAAHQTDQLVAQSLFADGFIKYSIMSEPCDKPHFKVIATHEEILPDSADSMTWKCDDWGMQMKLALEIPALIVRGLPGFLERLGNKAGMSAQEMRTKALFAVHPGGPKIIQQIGELLNLTPAQLEHSHAILRDFGNMSSATLPHIWEKMLNDPTIPPDSLIISLAFGPGLSISGALFL